MIWTAIFLICLFISAIVLLGDYSPLEEKTREKFLDKLTDLLHGTCEPIYEWDNSFRIDFTFEGSRFIFEDIEMPGFKKTINKAYLKHYTYNKLTLNFAENVKYGAIKSDILTVSDLSEETVIRTAKVDVPEELGEFKVFSDDPISANKLFENKKVVKLLASFKNYDERKFPYMPFRISDGVIILEFLPGLNDKPSLPSLRNDIHAIENILDKMLFIAKALNKACSN